MSDTSPFGFGRFVPGFDFLQNLAKNSAAGVPTMPGMSSWVAPTVNEEELEKRIEELKAVQFWLDQNSRALTATVQALEVQKMTLATLKGMNVAMEDLASAFTPKTPSPAPAAAPARGDFSASSFFSAAPPAPRAEREPEPEPEPEHEQDDAPDETEAAQGAASDSAGPSPAAGAAPGVVDPMQWWTALGSQFQQIAAHALKDVAQHQSALDASRDMATEAMKSATGMASNLAAQGLHGVQDATRKAVDAATAPAAAKRSAQAAPRKAAAAAPKKAGTAAKASAGKTGVKPVAKSAGKTSAKTADAGAARKAASAPAPAPTSARSARSRTSR